MTDNACTWYTWRFKDFESIVKNAQEGDCVSSAAFALRDLKGFVMYMSLWPIYTSRHTKSAIQLVLVTSGQHGDMRLGFEFWVTKNAKDYHKSTGESLCYVNIS